MGHPITKNIYYSLIEKLFIIVAQFMASLIMTRFLPREELGAMGVVAGAYAIVQIFNIALESIIVREYSNLSSNLDEVLSQFAVLNAWKSLILATLGLIIGGIFYLTQGRAYFLNASLSFLFVMIMDVAISPFVILSATTFNQKIVTNMSVVRWSLNALFLSGLYFYRNLFFVMIKDLILMSLIIALWHFYIKRKLNIHLRLVKLDWSFLKKGLLQYSLWTHLVGVVTNFVYRVDAFVLYGFVSIKTVGDYSVALTAANVANIVPSILAYQNSVALTHTKTKEEAARITGKFLRFSLLISLITLAGYVFLGKFYLRLLTGQQDVNEIYFYLLNIVFGLLIIRTMVAPMVSYINIKGNVKELFFKVKLPLLVLVAFNYTFFSFEFGAKGAAVSNVINGILWAGLILYEIRKYDLKVQDLGNMRNDINQLVSYVKKT